MRLVRRLFILLLILLTSLIISNNTDAEVKFCAVGDVLLDRGIRTSIQKNGVDHPFEEISALIRGYDLAFCNLECPLFSSDVPLNKRYCFAAEPAYLEGLKNAGFNVISIANNHTIDQGRDAFLKTKALLEKEGLYPIGGGKDQKEARSAVIVERNGLKFAFLGYIDMLLEGITYLEDRPAPAWATTEEIIEEIKKIRDKVDFVIVSFHWGVEFQHTPTINQVETAHKLIDAGADFILGHHPHVLQSIENYKGRYIIYSLGNFVFDQHKLPQRQSMIFCCTFEKGRIKDTHFIPILIRDFRPYIAKGEDKKGIIEAIEKISEEYNIRLIEKNGKVLITDTALNTYVDVPIYRYKSNKREVLVFRSKIVLLDEDSNILDTLLIKDSEELKDCCGTKDPDCVRIYGILGKKNQKRGEYIVVFPVSSQKIENPFRDIHKLNPWKVMMADVDGDENPELCVGVWKKTRYFNTYENRLFIYNRSGNYIYPKWFGSRFANPFIDFDFKDMDGDGKEELILLERDRAGVKKIVSYKWRIFGFEGLEIMKEGYKSNILTNLERESIR
ncbi:TPA: hypothetical protein DCX15_05180 [bacterium]|nr:hypothetical protein [bacterium]